MLNPEAISFNIWNNNSNKSHSTLYQSLQYSIYISIYRYTTLQYPYLVYIKTCMYKSGINKQSTLFLPSKGGNQLMLASQCESRKMSTCPVAARAPSSLVRIRPSLFLALTTFTLVKCSFT